MMIVRNGLVACVILALWAMSASAQSPAARVFKEVGIDQKLNEQVPLDLQFRNERGDTVSLRQYFGRKPVIISLVYYNCPMLCNQILNGMVETFKTMKFRIGQEFDVVSVSIDPSESYELASEKKQRYVRAYNRDGTADGWHFLVGDPEPIARLADAVGFRYTYDEATAQYAHASAIMVATPEGRLARYHFGIEFGARDLQFALMEASQNRIGSPVDKLLLLCYHYDPMTGKYGLVVANLLRIGGALTILVVVGYMLVNFRRDRKARKAHPQLQS